MPDYLSRVVFESFNLPPEVALARVDKQGRYWVASDGRVLSVCKEQPRYLKLNNNGNGYYYFDFDGKRKYIHRTLAKAFNQDPKKKPLIERNAFIVHHLDFNKYNNSLDNLCILTPEKHRAIHTIRNKIKRWETSQCQKSIK